MTLKNINDKLLEMGEQLKEKERLAKRLEKAQNECLALKNQKERLYDQLEKENQDVEKLEKLSFTSFYYGLMGNKDQQLDKEKKEAMEVKHQYDRITYMYEKAKKDVVQLSERLDALKFLDLEYEHLLKEKEELLKRDRPKKYEIIEEVTNLMMTYRNDIKELTEAIFVGKQLGHALDQVLDTMNKAKSWGTFDLLGGGFIATMVKHAHLDEAKEKIDEAGYQIKRFNRELKDVALSSNISLDISSFQTFADYFFDGFFADLSVQDKINDALYKVEMQRKQLDGLMNYLEEKIEQNQEVLIDLNLKKKRLIEESI